MITVQPWKVELWLICTGHLETYFQASSVCKRYTNENSPRKPKPGPGLTLEKGASKRRKPYNPKDPPHL